MMKVDSLKIDKTVDLFIDLLLLVLGTVAKTRLDALICLGGMIPLEAQSFH